MSQFVLALSSPMESEHRAAVGSVRSENDDARLLDQYLFDGDTDALVTLYDRHNHRLYLYCLKLLGSQQQAEDLTQELWERVARLRARPQHVLNPTGFFIRIARNLCLNQLKARRRTSPLEDLHEGAHPSVVQREMSELEELAIRALDELPHDYREVMVLNHYCGYRLDEIATLLGKTPDAIRKRASRARQQLRERVIELIEQQGDDPSLVLSRYDNTDGQESR